MSPEAAVPPEEMLALNESVKAVVKVLRDGGYSDLAISTMLIRHVAHLLSDIGPTERVIRS